jgi:hypothetical protein
MRKEEIYPTTIASSDHDRNAHDDEFKIMAFSLLFTKKMFLFIMVMFMLMFCDQKQK